MSPHNHIPSTYPGTLFPTSTSFIDVAAACRHSFGSRNTIIMDQRAVRTVLGLAGDISGCDMPWVTPTTPFSTGVWNCWARCILRERASLDGFSLISSNRRWKWSSWPPQNLSPPGHTEDLWSNLGYSRYGNSGAVAAVAQKDFPGVNRTHNGAGGPAWTFQLSIRSHRHMFWLMFLKSPFVEWMSCSVSVQLKT